MKHIILLTGNQRKKASFEKAFQGKHVTVETDNPWLPEIQAETNEEIAAYAARYGADLLGKPVVKMDSGFYIEGLKGFPGPLVRYADKQIGAELFFTIVQKLGNKACSIRNSLAFCEPGGEPQVFTSGSQGRLIDHAPVSFQGSFIDNLYIPEHGANPQEQTMGQLREEDYDRFLLMWGDAEQQFVDWFLSQD